MRLISLKLDYERIKISLPPDDPPLTIRTTHSTCCKAVVHRTEVIQRPSVISQQNGVIDVWNACDWS